MGRDVEVLEQGTGRTSQQVVKRAEQMMQKSTSPIARHSLHNLPCICFVYIQLPKQAKAPRSPVSAVDLVGGPAERVDHLAAVLGGAGRNLVAHVDVRRKGALQQLLVGARDDGSELVVGKRLVELSDVVRDVLLVPIVDVAGGADLELVLGGVYALGEGHLGAFGGLQERTTNRFVNNNVTRFKTRVCVRLLCWYSEQQPQLTVVMGVHFRCSVCSSLHKLAWAGQSLHEYICRNARSVYMLAVVSIVLVYAVQPEIFAGENGARKATKFSR